MTVKDGRNLTDSTVEQGVPVASENVYSLRDGVMGGLIAGVVMVVMMALWGYVTGRGPWYPVNLIAGTILPSMRNASDVQLMQFDLVATIVGTIIHFALSIALGLIYALLLPTLPGSPFLWALVIGTVLWAGAQYAILPLLNPEMAEVQGEYEWTFVGVHIVYSIVLGLYLERADQIKPLLARAS